MNQHMQPNFQADSTAQYFTGILGALIGALVGAVPWFLVSTFTGFFVGWLGFLVAWCSFFGYKLFRGVRSKGFALTVIIICSIAAIILSDFAGNMVSLIRNADVQAAAAMYGISAAELSYRLITDPEVFGELLPNLLIGLAIGVLGIISIRKQVGVYVSPAPAAEESPVNFVPYPPYDPSTSPMQEAETPVAQVSPVAPIAAEPAPAEPEAEEPAPTNQ